MNFDYAETGAGGALSAFGACYGCGNDFWFNPDTVPSIPIDPVTNRPPDMGGDPERAVRQPVCPDCMTRRADARSRS